MSPEHFSAHKKLNLSFLRQWRRYVLLLVALCFLAAASAINGWRSFVPAQMILAGQDELGQKLPEQKPLSGPLLVISPHPDDETLGAAGMIQEAIGRGQDVWVVFMTSGDAFPWTLAYVKRLWDGGVAMRAYAEMRMAESRAAAKVLGVPADHVLFLGFPDKGMTPLESQFLATPYTSDATRVNKVPYAGTVQPGAPYTGRQVAAELQQLGERIKPKNILTTSVLDGHPDHRATAHFALRLAETTGAKVYFFPVHDGLEWPVPKGHHPDLGLYPPRAEEQGGTWRRFPLTQEQQQGKARAVEAYRSQTLIIGRFMWAFVRRNELLRPAEASASNPSISTGGQ